MEHLVNCVIESPKKTWVNLPGESKWPFVSPKRWRSPATFEHVKTPSPKAHKQLPGMCFLVQYQTKRVTLENLFNPGYFLPLLGGEFCVFNGVAHNPRFGSKGRSFQRNNLESPPWIYCKNLELSRDFPVGSTLLFVGVHSSAVFSGTCGAQEMSQSFDQNSEPISLPSPKF